MSLDLFEQLCPLDDAPAKMKELKGKTFEELEPDWLACIRKY